MQWTRPNRCDNSGPNCAEIAVDPTNGDRVIRNSRRLDVTVRLDQQEWAALEESIAAGQRF